MSARYKQPILHCVIVCLPLSGSLAEKPAKRVDATGKKANISRAGPAPRMIRDHGPAAARSVVRRDQGAARGEGELTRGWRRQGTGHQRHRCPVTPHLPNAREEAAAG